MTNVEDIDALPVVEFKPTADVISHVHCPECDEFGNTGLKEADQIGVVQCRTCETLFKKESPFN